MNKSIFILIIYVLSIYTLHLNDITAGGRFPLSNYIPASLKTKDTSSSNGSTKSSDSGKKLTPAEEKVQQYNKAFNSIDTTADFTIDDEQQSVDNSPESQLTSENLNKFKRGNNLFGFTGLRSKSVELDNSSHRDSVSKSDRALSDKSYFWKKSKPNISSDGGSENLNSENSSTTSGRKPKLSAIDRLKKLANTAGIQTRLVTGFHTETDLDNLRKHILRKEATKKKEKVAIIKEAKTIILNRYHQVKYAEKLLCAHHDKYPDSIISSLTSLNPKKVADMRSKLSPTNRDTQLQCMKICYSVSLMNKLNNGPQSSEFREINLNDALNIIRILYYGGADDYLDSLPAQLMDFANLFKKLKSTERYDLYLKEYYALVVFPEMNSIELGTLIDYQQKIGIKSPIYLKDVKEIADFQKLSYSTQNLDSFKALSLLDLEVDKVSTDVATALISLYHKKIDNNFIADLTGIDPIEIIDLKYRLNIENMPKELNILQTNNIKSTDSIHAPFSSFANSFLDTHFKRANIQTPVDVSVLDLNIKQPKLMLQSYSKPLINAIFLLSLTNLDSKKVSDITGIKLDTINLLRNVYYLGSAYSSLLSELKLFTNSKIKDIYLQGDEFNSMNYWIDRNTISRMHNHYLSYKFIDIRFEIGKGFQEIFLDRDSMTSFPAVPFINPNFKTFNFTKLSLYLDEINKKTKNLGFTQKAPSIEDYTLWKDEELPYALFVLKGIESYVSSDKSFDPTIYGVEMNDFQKLIKDTSAYITTTLTNVCEKLKILFEKLDKTKKRR